MVNKDFDLTKINTFPKLLDYLRVKLDWPIKDENLDDLTFEYSPDELGITDEHHININGIQQLRPLSNNQPWGIFFIDFESKKLPIVLLRRLLSALVPKNRASSQSSNQPTWILDDLLFVSLLGEEKNRQVCFSHFKETEKGLPVLQTFSWDETETHFYYLKKFNLGSLRWPSDVNNSDEWKSDWSSAFTASHGQVIKNSKELSVELAKIAKSIRHTVNEIYKYETDNGHYHKLLGMFKEALIHDLEPDDFSDMVAQTVTYGLFSAAATGEKLTGLSNLSDLIPNTNPFLKSLFDELTTISNTKQNMNFDELGLIDLLDILNETNMDAIIQQFGRQTGGGSEDPVIHFYEDFLEEYDKHEKVEKGVFYTPRPVVSFIVRSTHEIIKTEFGLEDGLADTSTWVEVVKKNPGLKKPPHARMDDPFIQILDPAVGTGTFLVEVIDLIYNIVISKWEKEGKSKGDIKEEWNDYVNDHLIPRIFGFELMMAPYSICHVKLGLKLKETGFDINNAKNRFNIFLTNTLEEPQDLEASLFKPFLAIESEEANKVKLNLPITVIIGNPPYSGISTNKGEWISELINNYKYVDGEHFNERKHWLNDDYVKFIRFGESILDKTGYGVLNYINNHSFIDNITFRGMRWHLLNTYDKIIIFDLHGNAKKKEICPDGSLDNNVFDIQQGVAINAFIKITKNKNQGLAKLFHGDLWGTRTFKYSFLAKNSLYNIFLNYEPIAAQKPYLFFLEKDNTNYEDYAKCIGIEDIFPLNSVAMITARDKFCIDFELKKLETRIDEFANKNITDSSIQEKYKLHDTSTFKISNSRKNIFKDKNLNNYYQKVNYRPFDSRHIFYNNDIVERPLFKTMNHLIRDNVGLVFRRQQLPNRKTYYFISNKIISDGFIRSDNKGSESIAPLYLYKNEISSNLFSVDKNDKVPNINKEFSNQIREKLGLKLNDFEKTDSHTCSPINLLDYIYAILYSNNYRKKYDEFLDISYPKIPFTKNQNIFWSMVELGKNLREIHLFEDSKIEQPITAYPKNGDNLVVQRKYDEGKVFINKEQYFDGVPEISWNFYIGGYQPAQKWLKDRKGRKLSAEDIEHYQKIIVALTETDRIMKEIDKVYPEVEKDLIEFKLDDLEKEEIKKAKPDKNQNIFDLIAKGEGSNIEFKATLQKSIDNPNIPPTVIENNVIKSIAGFCNTEGGHLLIGVKDNGDIIGIEQDNFQSNDKFKNHLKNILDARVTKSVFSYIKTEFYKIESNTVCCIECNKSDNPLFVDYEGVNHFYKRNLESTDSLNPQETMEWANKGFK